MSALYICVIDQAWGQDGWILAKFFFCVFVEVHKNAKKERGQYPATLTEQAWSIKDLLYGFTFKLKLQQQNKTGHKTTLLGKKFFIAGRCKIYFQCIIGLACNREEQRILNYLRALTSLWLKGSIQLLRTKKFRFSQEREDLNRIQNSNSPFSADRAVA